MLIKTRFDEIMEELNKKYLEELLLEHYSNLFIIHNEITKWEYENEILNGKKNEV